MLRAAFNVAGDEYDLAGWNNPFRKMSDATTDSKVRYPLLPATIVLVALIAGLEKR